MRLSTTHGAHGMLQQSRGHQTWIELCSSHVVQRLTKYGRAIQLLLEKTYATRFMKRLLLLPTTKDTTRTCRRKNSSIQLETRHWRTGARMRFPIHLCACWLSAHCNARSTICWIDSAVKFEPVLNSGRLHQYMQVGWELLL